MSIMQLDIIGSLIGVTAIDQQHQKLFHLLKSLALRAERDERLDNLDHLFAQIVDYNRYHFMTEEALMTLVGFPDLLRHRIAHNEIMKKLVRIQHLYLEAQTDRDAVGRTLIAVFSRWILDHMVAEDRAILHHVTPEISGLTETEMFHRIRAQAG